MSDLVGRKFHAMASFTGQSHREYRLSCLFEIREVLKCGTVRAHGGPVTCKEEGFPNLGKVGVAFFKRRNRVWQQVGGDWRESA